MIAMSIIVLFHNNSHIDTVLDSITNQILEQDEVIIVNDYSDEQHLKIINRFLSDRHVVLINSDVKGNRSYNRNLGAKYSKNDGLLFVDGDIVLLDDCINLMRISLENGNVGVVGNILQSNYTPEQMNLKTGFDYMTFATQKHSLSDFARFNLHHDGRAHTFVHNLLCRTRWQYFYSGYCAIAKDAFNMTNGYSESFTGWGAEDVEMGYRLEKIGEIDFVARAYGYHFPHNRDLFYTLFSNRKNLYYFLERTHSSDLELLLTYGVNYEIVTIMDYIKDKIIQLNLSHSNMQSEFGNIYIYPLNKEHRNGHCIYIDKDGKTISVDLLGLALPFNNNQFKFACLTTDIFCYPEIIYTRILQEAVRVSEEVRIFKVASVVHPHWDNNLLSCLKTGSSSTFRIFYHSNLISDYSFHDCGEYYKVGESIVHKMPTLFLDNMTNVLECKKIHNKYLLFDLTNGRLSNDDIKMLEEKLAIKIMGIYSITIYSNEVTLSKIIFGEIQTLTIPFIYLIDDETIINTDDSWWTYKHRNNDIIIKLPDIVKV